mgnify:CR=1 FL=1
MTIAFESFCTAPLSHIPCFSFTFAPQLLHSVDSGLYFHETGLVGGRPRTHVQTDGLSQEIRSSTDQGTEGTKVAVGTTAQRGSTTGQWRYNTTTGYFEGRNAAGNFSTLEPTPTITGVDVTEVDSQAGGDQTIVVTGTNFVVDGGRTIV